MTVYRSNLGFADKLGKLRFGIAARGQLARHFCAERWALIADLDEFWLPPPEFDGFSALSASLDKRGHVLCKGIMLDCFPETLATIAHASGSEAPHQVAPWFEDISPVIWPAGQARVASYHPERNVRMRIASMLAQQGLLSPQQVKARGCPTLYKAPLAKWLPSISMASAHALHATYNNAHQMVCAHYKFVPTWTSKVEGAITSKSYYNASIEYEMLALAKEHLTDTPLLGPSSKQFALANLHNTLLF